MTIPAVKMSGAGNDFVVVDAAALPRGTSERDLARAVCRRGLSVGADGLVLVRRQEDATIDVRFRNPDGSDAFCGNGTRCAARFAALRGLAAGSMRLHTAAGDVPATVEGTRVRLELPPPRDLGPRTLSCDGVPVSGRLVDAGVPHFLVEVESVGAAPLERFGPALRSHPDLGPRGANVNVIELGARLEIRTWERGVEGETLACGSGALAAALVAARTDGGGRYEVVPASGIPLVIELLGPPDRPEAAHMTGDARIVFEGSIPAEALTWTRCSGR